MAQRRRTRSEMYQVDFVAALFGAFLLLWISKVGSGGGGNDVVAGVVVFQAWCTNNDGASLLPSLDRLRCASPEIVFEAASLMDVNACDALPVSALTEELSGVPDDTEILRESLGLTDAPIARGSGMSARVTFFAQDGSEMKTLRFGGLAIAPRPNPTVEVAVGYGPTEAPAFVAISSVDRAFIAVDCSALSGVACGERFALFEGPYGNRHPSYHIRVQSSEWPQKCLQSASGVTPDGARHALEACVL